MNKVNERQSNYELLRIVSMLFIILWHVIFHGEILDNCENEVLRLFFLFMAFVVHVHVNSFVLVTGYFQSQNKFKQSSVWSLINASLFYRIVFVILFSCLGLVTLTNLELLQRTFILNIEDYWFITTYLILYCLSPFLNKFIRYVDKRHYEKLLLLLFFLMSVIPYLSGNRIFNNNGYTLYNFIFLYLIGGYLRKYDITKSFILKRISKSLLQIILICCFFFCACLNFSIYETSHFLLGSHPIIDDVANNFISMSFSYSNPMIMIQTIVFFLFFGTLNFQSKIINFLSKFTVEVYLIHSNIFVNRHLYQWLGISGVSIISYSFIGRVLVVVFFIYVSCSILGFLRQSLFRFIYHRKLAYKIRKKYYNFLNNIYIS